MTSLKLKCITYPSVSILIGACVAVIAFCIGGFNVVGAVLLGIGGGLVASCAARVSLHMTQDDYSPFMFQVAIYHAVVCLGWFIFVLAQTWGAIYFGLAVMVGAGMMCLFTRFLESDEGKVWNLVEDMCETERYYRVGNVDGAPQDLSRPVCAIDGVNYTIREAEQKGFVREAAEARKNLYEVVASVVREDKENKE